MKRVSLVLVFVLFAAFSDPVSAQVTFYQPPTYSSSGAVFVADFNGDGKPDVLEQGTRQHGERSRLIGRDCY